MPHPTASRRPVLRWLSLFGLVLACVVAIPAAATAASVSQPFDCTSSTIFLGQGGAEGQGLPTQLRVEKYQQGETTFSNLGNATDSYNAMGFNPLDHFVYAINASDHLLKIDNTGSITNLGFVGAEGLFNVGAFDPAGNFYFMQGSSSTLWTIAPGSTTATPIRLDASPDVADLTYINGALWGEHAGTVGSDANITSAFVRVDPTTGAVDSFPQTILPIGVSPGAAWTYQTGELGLDDNNTGNIYKVQIGFPSSDSPTFTLEGTASDGGTGAPNNDGTSCAGLPSDLSITKSSPGEVNQGSTVTWEINVRNGSLGWSSGSVVTDNVPPNVTNVHTTPVTDGTCTVTGNHVVCNEGPLQPGDSYRITLQGTAPQAAGANFDNTAIVNGNEPDPDITNNHATGLGSTFAPVPFCRGTALQLLGLHLGEANGQEVPCTDQVKNEVRVHVAAPSISALLNPLVDATALTGTTGVGEGGQHGQATADVANVSINILGALKLSAQALHSEAGATFSGTCGLASLAGSSRIAQLTINGKTYDIGNQPITIPIGIGTIYINQTVATPGSIIQRALFVDLPGTLLDITVAESKAGVGCV